jgi:hypothetical protein
LLIFGPDLSVDPENCLHNKACWKVNTTFLLKKSILNLYYQYNDRFYWQFWLEIGTNFGRNMPLQCVMVGCLVDVSTKRYGFSFRDRPRFLIKLGIKPLLMHLLEISIFSLNNVIVRLTKITEPTKIGHIFRK